MMPDQKTKTCFVAGRIRTAAPLLLVTLFAILAVGCQPTKVNRTLMPNFAGNADEVQMEFWHRLAEKKLTSNNEAFHALLIFVEGEDKYERYYQRVDALKRKGMLMPDFEGKANEAVSRGTMSVALFRALDLKGGVIISIFGPSPRYATRELRYRNIYPESSPNQTFSGGEFIGLMGRAEDWLAVQRAKAASGSNDLPAVNTEMGQASDEPEAG